MNFKTLLCSTLSYFLFLNYNGNLIAQNETKPNTKTAYITLTKGACHKLIHKFYDNICAKESKILHKDWFNKKFISNGKTLQFETATYGEKPKNGRSLYISLHGGGGVPKEVNDEQWENQIAMTSDKAEYYHIKEGVVVIPRAPVDEWNMWFQSEMDDFIQKIILSAVLFAEVNPNKVYIMGYSAGGDGTFRLASRLADYFAAASMSAGHPGEVKPTNLFNIGFSLNMGGKDNAYNRNELARTWKKELANLQKSYPNAYKHQVNIFEKDGHWMHMKDKIAIPFMSEFVRNPYPNRIHWMQNSFALRKHFYWIGISEADMKKEGIADSEKHIIKVTKQDNVINIEENYAKELYIYLNDELVDMDKEVIVNYQGNNIFKGNVKRNASIIEETANARKDKAYIFSAVLIVQKNKNVKQGA